MPLDLHETKYVEDSPIPTRHDSTLFSLNENPNADKCCPHSCTEIGRQVKGKFNIVCQSYSCGEI